jgi:hypothetical protein
LLNTDNEAIQNHSRHLAKAARGTRQGTPSGFPSKNLLRTYNDHYPVLLYNEVIISNFPQGQNKPNK